MGARLDPLGERPPGGFDGGRLAAGAGIPAVADVNTDRRPAGADAVLEEPVRRWGWGLAGCLDGEPLLLGRDPVPRPRQVTDLHPLQEAEEVEARGWHVGHTFDSSFLQFWVPLSLDTCYVLGIQNRQGAAVNDTDKGGRPAIGPKVPINFPAEQLAQVDDLAREAGITRAAWIRQAVADAIQREEAAMKLRITVSDIRRLLGSGNEQPVLYINVEDGPAQIDVWAGAYVAHHWRIATREEIADMVGDEPSDSDIRSILGDLQEIADQIEL